jgi:hypothetical protein
VVVANIKASVTSTGIPGGYGAYVPITITNSQSSPTGSGFQQMVSFNPSQSSAYTVNEASDLGNIRFYQGGQELYSWCESGCTSASSNAVFWINLPSGIGASSSIALNMYFLTNTVEYDGVYAGECPTCNSIYAKYDNGGKVFNFYDNFAGNSGLSSAWTVSQDAYTVSNGLTITQTGSGTPGGGTPGYIATSAYSIGSPFMTMDWYGSFPNTNNIQVGFTVANNHGAYMEGCCGPIGFQETYAQATNTVGNYGSGYLTVTATQNYVYTITLNGLITTAEDNYGSPQVTSSSTQDTFPLPIAYRAAGAYVPTVFFTQWIRARANPPGLAMPTTSFGAITH